MKSRKKSEASIFKGIRKPTAPPAKKLGEEKAEEKIHPAGRKSKHKKKDSVDGDI